MSSDQYLLVIYFTFTHPQYRNRGAGHLLMEWGTRKADELGLEIFVEASPLGFQLYSKHGFRAERVVELTPPRQADEKDEEWAQCRRMTEGLKCAVLRRPVKSIWPESANYISPDGNLEENKWGIDNRA